MFKRYAVFFTPSGPLATFGAAWLGWDSAQGCAVPHPGIDGIDVASVTATPRKYGLHGTLKAPFRLADHATLARLQAATEAFARQHAAFDIGQLALRYDCGFIALRPETQSVQLQDFAAATVKAFDPFRAPLSDAEIARRRRAPLTPRQDQQMLQWGYPLIFDDFHFHLTLSGALPQVAGAQVITALHPHLAAIIAQPCVIDAITLMGEDNDGMFHQIHRYTLTG